MVRSTLQKHSSLVFIFVLGVLTIVMTWPIAARIGTHIPGSEGDAWVHLWTFRWIRDSLLAGQSPFFTDRIFYPQGTSLTSHNIAWVNIAAWLPLQAIVGEGPAYSMVFLAVLILNGFAIYLLVREWTDSHVAAWIAGFIGAFWPFILSHHNSPNLNLIAWIPLAMVFTKRTLERQRVIDALIAAGFIALIGLSRWQMLVIGGTLIALLVGHTLATNRQARNARVFKLMILMGASALLLMSPFLTPLIAGQLGRQNPEEIFTSGGSQTDLLAYVVPSRFHPLWGKAVFDRYYGNFGINQLFVPFIGYTVLILALYGTFSLWKQARFWVVAAAMLITLALGSELLINGEAVAPLPYRWLESLFIFKILRDPDRFNAVLVIPMAVLAGLGATSIWHHSKLKRWQGAGIVVILAALILFEYAVKYPMFGLDVPGWYQQLAAEEGDFAVADLPIGTRTHDEHYMHYQFVHGKSLVGGKVARPPDAAFTFIDSVPLLRSAKKEDAPPTDLSRFSHQFELLRRAGVRYLVLHKDRFAPEDLAAWQQWLRLDPIHEDDVLAVYPTEWQLGEAMALNPTTLEGLGWVATSLTPTSTTQDGWVTAGVRWGSLMGLDEEYDLCFTIRAVAGDDERGVCQPLSPEWSTALWQPNEVVDVSYPLHLDPFLERGVYEVSATISPAGRESAITEPVIIGQVTFEAIPREFTSDDTPEAGALRAKWTDDIGLVSARVSTTDEQLTVDLSWLALDRLDKSYKIFLHLIDEKDGNLVGQVDTAPRAWAYPTTWWEQNEIIDDGVTLPLVGLGPGRYQLWIGLYDEATGERLLLESSIDGDDVAGADRLQLTIIER